MTDDDRFRLHFGPYTTPPFQYGQIVHCEVRGDVTIVGLSDGEIAYSKCRDKSVDTATLALR